MRKGNAHDKVYVEEEVELPAFLDHGISENVAQCDSVDIAIIGQISNTSQLKR